MRLLQKTQIVFREFVPKEKERTYYERTFPVPEGVCRMDIEYDYRRYAETEENGGVRKQERSIIDLALRDGRGNYIGASGAGRRHIWISGWDSSDGYARTDPDAGEWAIIVGAYKVADEGVEVTYTVTFTHQERTLLKGETHIHTTASDGRLTAEHAVQMAKDAGLDYIFLTDHNGYAHNLALPVRSDITVLPGGEWTHYEGHAGMLGVGRPLESAFCANSADEAWAKLAEARKNGALVVLNHPFCPNTGWHFGIRDGEFDLVEVINGGTTPQANEECVQWWHDQLCAGKRIPVIGGSDFHRMDPTKQIGQPATAVWALSRSPRDILQALRDGCSYLILWSAAPVLWAEAAGTLLGGTARSGAEVHIRLEQLKGGDVLRILTDQGCEEIICEPHTAALHLTRVFPAAKFVRFEVLRWDRQVLLSNPIYFT